MTRKVLCISQNKSMTYLLQTVLSKQNQLVLVDDVFYGMHVLKHQEDVSLIIIDIDYQVKECINFIHHIESSKLYNRPLIILLSGENQKVKDFVVERGSYNCFLKPFSPMELAEEVSEQLQAATHENQNSLSN